MQNFRILLTLSVFIIVLSAGCKKKPEPCFTLNKPLTDLHINKVIQFSAECSIDAEDFFWDFGDGSTANTTPVTHTYTATGSYEVVLTATVTGRSETISRTIEIKP